jgi:hypothetical protein
MRFAHTSRLARQIGEANLAQIVEASRGMYVRVPILGTGYYSFDGHIVRACGEAGGFASMSDLVSEATAGGKRQEWTFAKSGSLAVAAAQASLWNVGPLPAAGGTVTARPGGAAPVRTTTGAVGQTNAAAGDTLHITTWHGQASAAPNTLLIYDRIFHAGSIDHTINTAQSITGVPTRYDTTTSPGNFAFLEVTSALGATAQNVTLTYMDQDGNTAEAAAAIAVIASSGLTRICHGPFHFIPLNATDTGMRKATDVTFSAANTGGTSALVIGHPLAWLPQNKADEMQVMDGINSAFNLVRFLDNACVAFLELKGVATATNYVGSMTLVSG